MKKILMSKQMSESVGIAILLAMVGGFLDSYTYILRGGVFANAQTGNIVLMGIRGAQGDFTAALRYLVPVLAFAAGVAVTEAVRRRADRIQRFHWRQGIVLAEILILFAVGWIASGRFDYLVNLSVSFVCALQVESFRKINGNAYATTMCTGNLRSATESLYCYYVYKEKEQLIKSLQYYAVIVFFIIGAAVGVPLTKVFANHAIWLADIVLLSAFLLMFIEQDI